MINYIPKNDSDREEFINKNKLYKEIFLYRADYGCNSCDNSINCNHDPSSLICRDCLNNSNEILDSVELDRAVKMKLLSLSNIDKIKFRNKLMHLILGKQNCPICSNKDWTKNLVVYFANGDGDLKLSEVKALYCPFCGKEID